MLLNKEILIGIYSSYYATISGFWTFNYSTSSVLTNFVATTNTPSSIIITWGDNSTDTVNSGINISHNYTI